MGHRLRWLCLLLMLFDPGLARAEDGKLAGVRTEVRGEASKLSAERDGSCDDTDHAQDGNDDCDAWGRLSMWMLAGYCAKVTESCRTPFYFPKHPFAEGYPGFLRYDGQERRSGAFGQGGETAKDQPDALCHTKVWSCRVSVEEGNDFDGLNRLGGQVFLDTTCRIGALFNGNYYSETVNGCGCADVFIGDANVTFGLLRCPEFMDRIGVGMKFLADPIGTEYGFNFLYGADLFVLEPLVLSWSIDGGSLGDAGVFHGRGTAGWCWSHGEVFAGYDYLRIGSVVLDGPLVGLRLWF